MDCNTNPAAAQARSPAILAHLRACASAAGVMSFRDFTQAVLYAPGLGYYARAGVERVGRRRGSDFYTASSLGQGVFGQLLRAAAINLLFPEKPDTYDLLELAAEPDTGVFGSTAAPFSRLDMRRLGDGLVPSARAVVFANEWLDAQPFHRFVFRRGTWRELGVRITGEVLEEIELPEFSEPARTLRESLPEEASEDYHLDISLNAEILLRELAAAPWQGGLILADYGYDWDELIRQRPAGTARAYCKHEVTGDLLVRPGEQDLTCHVCWNRLEAILSRAGFKNIRVERQEAFFMRHAPEEIERIISEQPDQFSSARQTLMELLHPAHLGQKFQILSAWRT